MTFLTFLSLAAAATLTIAERNKTSQFKVIYPEKSDSAIKHACDLFKYYVNKVCAVQLDIVADSSLAECPEHCILVGYTKYTESYLPNLNEITKSLTCDDSFHMEIKGTALIIVGGNRGCHYGIFELLEKYCGIYWFGKNNYKIPTLNKVEFTFETDHQNPFIKMRDCYSGGVNVNDIRMYNRNNYINYLPDEYGGSQYFFAYRTTHTFFQFISPEEFYDTHPEYFALTNGKRVTNGQICLSNNEVLEIVINKSLKAVEELKSKDTRFLSISMQDGGPFCNCSECRRMNEMYSGSPTLPSGTLIWFVNQVAEAVKSNFPERDVYIDTIAYFDCEQPPNNIKARDNVMVRICPIGIDHIKSINESDHQANKNLMNYLIGWHKVTSNIHVWHYTSCDRETAAPYANFRSIIKNVYIYIDNGVKGFFFLGGYETTDLFEMKNWIVSKLLWNPYQDVNLLIKTFTDNFYGPVAGPFMRDFVDGYHDIAIRDNRQTYIYMGFHSVNWWDESKYFINYLPRMEAMIEKVKDNKYFYNNMLKQSIPCLYMAYFRHLISYQNNITTHFKWDFDAQAIQVANQLPLAVETAKNLYDRIFMQPETMMGIYWDYNKHMTEEILKEGHGNYITVLQNENNYSFGIANGHDSIIGGFIGPDGYNYISGEYGGLDYHGWYFESVSSFTKIDKFHYSLFLTKMNTSDTLQLMSNDVDYLYKEMKLYSDYLEINFIERNWYQSTMHIRPTTKLSLNLGDTRNVCYKICDGKNDCEWVSIVSNKSSPFFIHHMNTALFSNKDKEGFVSFSIASPVTHRGIVIEVNRSNFYDIPLVIATKTGTVHLAFTDDITHLKDTNHTNTFRLRVMEPADDLSAFVEPVDDDNELGSLVTSEFYETDGNKAKFKDLKEALHRRVVVVSKGTNYSAFKAFFDPRMIDESHDYVVHLRAMAHIDHTSEEAPRNESVAFEVILENTTQVMSEICRFPVLFGDVDDGEFKWYEFPKVSLSSYARAYVTTSESLNDVYIDAFSFKEVPKHNDNDDGNTEGDKSPKKGLNSGEIAGIVIGVIVVIAVALVLVVYLMRIRIRYAEDSDAIIRASI